ncbi:MAG: Asp23/Gls24 family envelope stress response protein [Ruminococcus sp.]|jgi:uncharacterized alkaline shock family protein YloU|nr:Asp23/Gls24 family envelope stress response protein [Ruminococcus sp.]
METAKENAEKSVKISKDVIEKICELALRECPSEAQIKPKLGFKDIFGKQHNRFADVKFYADSVQISLSVLVSENAKAAAVAERIQKKIMEEVRVMTGITVSKVNVFIAGLIPEKKDSADEPTE